MSFKLICAVVGIVLAIIALLGTIHAIGSAPTWMLPAAVVAIGLAIILP